MTKYLFTLLFLFGFYFLGAQKKNNFDVQAHAGGNGLYPGNSIPAFINAVKLGVNTLNSIVHKITQDGCSVHDKQFH